MRAIDNGIGRRTEMHYSTSTEMRLRDRAEGRPWQGELPMIVPLLVEIVDHDTVTGSTAKLVMRYHDGVYDGASREFRGFTTVTVDTVGDESIPTLRQDYSFFQGNPLHIDLIAAARERALAGSLQSVRAFSQSDVGWTLRQMSEQIWDARLEHDDASDPIYFPFITRMETREISSTGAPDRIEVTLLTEFDAHGNAGKRVLEARFDGAPMEEAIRSEERFSYTSDEANWLVRLPVRHEIRDSQGLPCALKIYHYDGSNFEGLPEGSVTRGLLSRTRELVLLAQRLPPDYVGERSAPLWSELFLDGRRRLPLRWRHGLEFAVERSFRFTKVGC